MFGGVYITILSQSNMSTLFKMVGKKKPTSFSLKTYTNVGIIPQKYLTFSFNSFATLMSNFKASAVPVPNY